MSNSISLRLLQTSITDKFSCRLILSRWCSHGLMGCTIQFLSQWINYIGDQFGILDGPMSHRWYTISIDHNFGSFYDLIRINLCLRELLIPVKLHALANAIKSLNWWKGLGNLLIHFNTPTHVWREKRKSTRGHRQEKRKSTHGHKGGQQ
jgi:hypothetical protein